MAGEEIGRFKTNVFSCSGRMLDILHSDNVSRDARLSPVTVQVTVDTATGKKAVSCTNFCKGRCYACGDCTRGASCPFV